ncbi:hypothetical protein SL103_12190 [Streptomyces lydicus]|uniref:Uncharacterized protein n=1 Tax=Streptomyces lydicus TaxID=47763 RepID=A0A1D7VJI4_9ACTN|nr:hypothetical protein SL103_12190 [Streptomyces lydicus]
MLAECLDDAWCIPGDGAIADHLVFCGDIAVAVLGRCAGPAAVVSGIAQLCGGVPQLPVGTSLQQDAVEAGVGVQPAFAEGSVIAEVRSAGEVVVCHEQIRLPLDGAGGDGLPDHVGFDEYAGLGQLLQALGGDGDDPEPLLRREGRQSLADQPGQRLP